MKTSNIFLLKNSKYKYKITSQFTKPLRTIRRTKTANITKDDVTFAAQ